jgi:ParB-like nuclease domain
LALKTDPGAAGSLVALADRIELWTIEKLRPYECNPRTHSETQVDQIAASMVEFGWTNPVLVDEQGGILAGHGRLLAARKLGLAEVPVIRFEHLSEAQKRAYMHDAAKDFQAAFIVANLDPLRALPILRVPGTGCEPELNDRQFDARRRVHKAMQALGGISSPAGSCVWHGVGLQRSVREWAMRQGWGGRPVRQEQAQGILIAALGMLARHFGYGEAKRAS